MKVIIAGGRDILDYKLVLNAIRESKFDITEVVSGMAKGVDTLAVQYANENDLVITPFFADWNTHGRAAGPIRNRQMAEYGDALIAIWDGESRGTKNMIEEATKRKLQVFVYRADQVCPRCHKIHNAPPVDIEKIVADHAADLAREIDKEALMKVGAWMDEDKGYALGTREKYEEFVRKRNESFGTKGNG
jgi:predicted Rossmann fold nucleotide-binding protein DprA/Smf involved in DNA uptake